MPRSASTRQISFRINRVAISIIATYSNNNISSTPAAGAIQFIKCMPQERWGIDTSQCPLRGLTRDGGIESRGDRGNAVDQRGIERPSLSERGSHYADDQTRDDNVLERHHAVLVRAQTLQRFACLDVVLQHTSDL